MSQYIFGPMEGATSSAAGVSGLVPQPASGDNNKYLKGNGTWEVVNELPSVTSSDEGKIPIVNNGGSWIIETLNTFYRQFWNSTNSISIPLSEDGKSYQIWCAGSSAGTSGAILDTTYGAMIFLSNGKYAITHKGSAITITESSGNLVVSSSSNIAMGIVEL